MPLDGKSSPEKLQKYRPMYLVQLISMGIEALIKYFVEKRKKNSSPEILDSEVIDDLSKKKTKK